MIRRHHKVMLVGDGAVGSSFAFSLLQVTSAVDELVIVDVNQKKAHGDAMDLQDITPFNRPTIIRSGSYSDAKDADIVVITAGVPRKPGETRLQLVNDNVKILKTIVTPVVDSGFDGFFVVSSNPVDILTTLTQRLSGFPKNRVIGTGTSLDSARLHVLLSQKLNVPVNTIDAWIMGEHGDTSFAAFNEATIDGQPLSKFAQISDSEHQVLEDAVHKRGGEIIANKGATFYGVAKCLAYIVKAILENHNITLTVSAPLNGEYGVKDMYLGVPAVINTSGIVKVIEYNLSASEKAKMDNSATKMQEVLDEVQL